jgi:hypothetical protein
MVTSVKNSIESAYHEYPTIERTTWVQKWPGQSVLCVSQMFWAAEVHDVFIVQKSGQMRNYHKFLTVPFVRGRVIFIFSHRVQCLLAGAIEQHREVGTR